MMNVLLKKFIVYEEYVKNVLVYEKKVLFERCLNVFNYDMFHDKIVIPYV